MFTTIEINNKNNHKNLTKKKQKQKLDPKKNKK
jgi:hypothetical protein